MIKLFIMVIVGCLQGVPGAVLSFLPKEELPEHHLCAAPGRPFTPHPAHTLTPSHAQSPVTTGMERGTLSDTTPEVFILHTPHQGLPLQPLCPSCCSIHSSAQTPKPVTSVLDPPPDQLKIKLHFPL